VLVEIVDAAFKLGRCRLGVKCEEIEVNVFELLSSGLSVEFEAIVVTSVFEFKS
jgi:hypothetical protein